MEIYFHGGPLEKAKTKTKLNWIGILILKKACSGVTVKVFVVITIIKTITAIVTIIMIIIIINNNSNNNKDNDNNNNSKDNTLHKQWSFPLKISSVNVTNSSVSCWFCQFTEEILHGQLHLVCSDDCNDNNRKQQNVIRSSYMQTTPSQHKFCTKQCGGL